MAKELKDPKDTKKNQPTRGRKRVESTFADKWEPEAEGDILEGFYLGSEEAAGKRRGEFFTVYHIRKEDGSKVSAAGAYLDSLMTQVPRGAYVWITYGGEKNVRNGPMKLFDIEVSDDTDLIDPYAAKNAAESVEEDK